MVAGAGIGIYSESLAHDPLAVMNGLAHQRPHAPLTIELAFPVGNDDLRAPEFSAQSLTQQSSRSRGSSGGG